MVNIGEMGEKERECGRTELFFIIIYDVRKIWTIELKIFNDCINFLIHPQLLLNPFTIC